MTDLIAALAVCGLTVATCANRLTQYRQEREMKRLRGRVSQLEVDLMNARLQHGLVLTPDWPEEGD